MLRRRFLNRSASLLLLLLGTLSLAELIAQTFALSLDPMFPVFLSAFCLFFWFGANGRKRFFPALLLAGLTLYAAFRLYSEDFREELVDLIEQIGGVYYGYFSGIGDDLPEPAYDHTALMLAFFFPLVYYFSQALTSARSRIFLVLLVHLPLTLACLSVTGSPEPITIFLLGLFAALLLVSGSVYTDDSGRGGVLWAAILPSAAVVLLCLLLADPVHYSFDEEDVARSQRFDRVSQMLTRIVNEGHGEASVQTPVPTEKPESPLTIMSGHWSVRNSRLNLSEGNRRTDDERVVLRVTAETSDCLYLRRCSFGDYTGTSWLLAEDGAGFSSLSFAALAAANEAARQEISISIADRSDLMLIPYFSPVAVDGDSYVRLDGSRDYTLGCYVVGDEIFSLSLSGAAAGREREYRSYAYAHFTELPETTRASAERILENAGISPGDEELIWEIAALVRGSGRYDLKTPAYPSDDYAIYFLTQAHQGYCIHFATAAAVLYRAAGIPARLTDGYLITTKAGETVDVRQGDQHAWVEVYLDGLGWVPVEATGHAGFFEDSGNEELPSPFSPEEEKLTEPVITPEPMPEPTPGRTAEPVTRPKETPPTETRPVISSEPGDETPTEPGTAAPVGTEEEKVFHLPRWLLSIPAALLIFCLRELLLLLRKRRVFQKNRRKAAIAVWREARHLYRRESDIPDEIQSCAERAAFGRDAPDSAQLQKARECLRGLERSARENPSLRTRLRLILFGRIFR